MDLWREQLRGYCGTDPLGQREIKDLIQEDPREPFLDLDSILDDVEDWEGGMEDSHDEDDEGWYDDELERPLNKDELDEARGEFNKRGEDGEEV